MRIGGKTMAFLKVATAAARVETAIPMHEIPQCFRTGLHIFSDDPQPHRPEGFTSLFSVIRGTEHNTPV